MNLHAWINTNWQPLLASAGLVGFGVSQFSTNNYTGAVCCVLGALAVWGIGPDVVRTRQHAERRLVVGALCPR